MKKIFLSLSALMMLMMSACGNVSHVNVIPSHSEVYSESEINSAVNVVKKYFYANFDDCTLNEITYAGDEVSAEHAEWAERIGGNQVIVLVSSFDVGESGGNGSLNPNDTYNKWMWILARKDNGKWEHVDHGY